MNLGALTATLRVDTSQMNMAERRLRGFEGNATSSFKKVNKTALRLKQTIMGLGLAFGAVRVGGMVKDYESALVDMAKVTDQSFSQIDKTIRGMDASLGNSTELMKGYYQVISAGVTDPEKALSTLTTASQLAKASHVEQSETVRALTKVMAGYKGSLKNASDAADLLLKTEKLGQTSVAELVPVIGDISNISNMAGASIEEMAGAMALITQTAGSTAEAATQWKALMTSLVKPTDEMTDAFGRFGSVAEALEKMGLVEWLERIQEVGGSAEGIADLLGGRKESLIAFQALISNTEALSKNIKEITDRTGALNQAWENYTKSAEGLVNEFKANVINTFITFGQKTLPMVNTALKTLNEHFVTIIDTIAVLGIAWAGLKIGGWITSLAGLAKALSGVKAGAAIKGFGALSAVMTGGQAVARVGGLTLAFKGLAAALGGPVGIAIAATGTAFYLANKHIKTMTESAKEARATLSHFGTGSLSSGILGGVDTAQEIDDSLQNKLTKEFEDRAKAAAKARKEIKAFEEEQIRQDRLEHIKQEWKEMEKVYEANQLYRKELEKIGKTAGELELDKLNDWYKEQIELLGETTPALKELYQAKKKIIEQDMEADKKQSFGSYISNFLKDVDTMQKQAKEAVQAFGISSTDAANMFKEEIVQKAEDTAFSLVSEFDNPYMRQQFISVLENLGRESGNRFYVALSEQLKKATDMVEQQTMSVEDKLYKAWTGKFGSGTKQEDLQFELLKEDEETKLYHLSSGLVSTIHTIGKAKDSTDGWMDSFDLDFSKKLISPINENLEQFRTTGQTAGENVGEGLYNGITQAVNKAVAEAKQKIESGLSSSINIRVSAQTGSVTKAMRGEL